MLSRPMLTSEGARGTDRLPSEECGDATSACRLCVLQA
jgi:hypothetical protein